MRVNLVFPPSLCLPNPIYYSLPLLAGALKADGRSVLVKDLNVLAADRLLTDSWVERVLLEAEKAVLEHKMDSSSSSPIEELLRNKAPKVMQSPAAKAVLRDPVRNFDPPAFKNAFSTVIEALDFFYILDQVISPHRENFGKDVIDFVRTDPWSPLRDLYDELLLDEALCNDPDVVGVCVAFPEQAAETVRLVAKLRGRKKDLHICLGGPLISLFHEKWLNNSWLFKYADSVVVGEGESSIVQLVRALENGGNLDGVRNLVYPDRKGGIKWNNPSPEYESMNEAPLPYFGSTDLSLYFTPKPLYPLMLSRGCYWGKCSFCSSGWREKYRHASKEKIREQVVDLAKRWNAHYIMLQDSSIPPNKGLELARIIKEESLEVSWYGTTRFEKRFLDRDYCRELHEGGCRSFLIGFESANQHVIDLMNKGFNLNEVKPMLENLKDAGISAELLWFIGFPNETRADALRTARFLVDNSQIYGVAALVGDYQLHPDSEVFNRPSDFGLTITGITNDSCIYSASSGMQMDEKDFLKNLFTKTGNRNLVCNGAHLPHLTETGIDLSGIEQPMIIPQEAIEFCRTQAES